MKHKHTPFLFLLFFCLTLQAQRYKEMMDDTQHNVYDVIKAGATYFKGREKGKGSGWKQFQRWIIDNEPVFFPTGDRCNYKADLPYLLGKQKLTAHNLKKSAKAAATKINWTEIGPYVPLKRYFDDKRNGNGRVDAIYVDPSNSNRIYIGCRGGGMWTTLDGGENWTVKTDNLGITGVTSIAVNPNNTDEIYIATALSDNRSLGVFKSLDAGDTWQQTHLNYELAFSRAINKILMDPSDPNILFAATSLGLVKTTDGFKTYTQVLEGNILDVEFKPGNTQVVYASNRSDKKIYKSINQGTSFTITGPTLISKPLLAVSPDNPNYVYVADKGVLYRSIDSGNSFVLRGNPDENKGQYGGFAVSDTDANTIINGSLDTFRSLDGGQNFSKVTNWIFNNSTGIGGNFVHADIREIVVVNGNIYLGTDGWLCKSTDGGNTYQILTDNIGNQEVYEHGLGLSQTNENTLVIGTQDNGTSILKNGVWRHWKGGDGGTSIIDNSNENIIYGSLYNGNFKRTDDGGSSSKLINLGDTKPGGLPPLVKHPTQDATLFLGEDNGEIWKSTNRGASWETIANLGGKNVVDDLAVAPSNPNFIYASIKNQIWKTSNAGATWTNITAGLPDLVIKGIAIDYKNPAHVCLAFSGYTDGEKVYRTENSGMNWTNISTGIPNIPMTDIVCDNNTTKTLYIATYTGVYYLDSSMSSWESFGTGLPNVRANDLEIQHTDASLFVGTWGRGVWKAPLLHSALSSNIQYRKSVLLYPNPVKDLLTIVCNNIAQKDIQLFNGFGQELKVNIDSSKKNNTVQEIDVSSLISGMYYLKINERIYKVCKQ